MGFVDLNLKKWKPKCRRILIIYWGPFGDVIITTPFLEHLRKGFPQAKIVYLIGTRAKFYEHGGRILENNPHVDMCIKSDVSVVRKILTDKPYDLIIDLFGGKFSNLVSHISGAKIRIWTRFKMRPKKFCYAHRLINGKWSEPVKINFKKGGCKAERFLEIIRVLGIKVASKISPKIYLSQEEKAFSQNFFKNTIGRNNFIIGMHPAGRVITNLWDAKKYSLLADKLIEESHAKVIVFYGPGEKRFANRVCKFSNHKIIRVFQKDIRKYISLVSRCNAFITSDGGPLHMALAVGVPCVGIFKYKKNALYWYAHYQNNCLFPVFIDKRRNLSKDKEVGLVLNKVEQALPSKYL